MREGNSNVWMPLTCPLLETWPATQTCALTGNSTSDPLVRRLALNPLSPTSHGFFFFHYGRWNNYVKILLIFLERGEERVYTWRETLVCEGNMDRLPLAHLPAGDLARNPDMCPDCESNR